VEADAETTGIRAGVDAGEASRLAARGASPGAWGAGRPIALLLTPRLRRAGHRNLALAFPQKTAAERQQILRKLYRNLGWLLAEFCQMPRYTPG
jgi:KDO2-lipid IV(A) lauroyltransferase